MEFIYVLTLIIISVGLNSSAQLIWKIGLKNAFKKITIKEIIRTLLRPLVFTGAVMYFFSALIWIIVLGNAELSYAYPFIALGYVLVTILSYFVLKEEITKKRIVGVLVIILGVIMVGMS